MYWLLVNPDATSAQVSDGVGLPTKPCKETLDDLKALRLASRSGSGSGTRWRLSEHAESLMYEVDAL